MSEEIDIKFVRGKLGWTQQQMADQLGLDRSTVSHAEKGRRLRGPTARLLRRIAEDNGIFPKNDLDAHFSGALQ